MGNLHTGQKTAAHLGDNDIFGRMQRDSYMAGGVGSTLLVGRPRKSETSLSLRILSSVTEKFVLVCIFW